MSVSKVIIYKYSSKVSSMGVCVMPVTKPLRTIARTLLATCNGLGRNLFPIVRESKPSHRVDKYRRHVPGTTQLAGRVIKRERVMVVMETFANSADTLRSGFSTGLMFLS
jgi:hypothetical protein